MDSVPSFTRASLVAPAGGTSWYEGAGLVESAGGLVDGIFKHEGGAIAGNGISGALGLLGAVMDPLQAVFAAGVGWLMEHVSFLREPLDRLLGNPKEIQGHAATWRNIQARIFESVTFFADQVNSHTAEWETTVADAYRVKARKHAEAVQALGGSCEFLAKVTLVAGAVVGVVRNTIRDIVAEVVGAAISKAVQAVLVVTIPKVVAEIAVLVADCVSKISKLMAKLSGAIADLTRQMGTLGELISRITKTLDSGVSEASRGATKIAAYRVEAAGNRVATPAASVSDYAKAYKDAFKTVAGGHHAAHGSTVEIIKETAQGSPISNGLQNAGSTADASSGRSAPSIELPL
jgi:hypothetical protein